MFHWDVGHFQRKFVNGIDEEHHAGGGGRCDDHHPAVHSHRLWFPDTEARSWCDSLYTTLTYSWYLEGHSPSSRASKDFGFFKDFGDIQPALGPRMTICFGISFSISSVWRPAWGKRIRTPSAPTGCWPSQSLNYCGGLRRPLWRSSLTSLTRSSWWRLNRNKRINIYSYWLIKRRLGLENMGLSLSLNIDFNFLTNLTIQYQATFTIFSFGILPTFCR